MTLKTGEKKEKDLVAKKEEGAAGKEEARKTEIVATKQEHKNKSRAGVKELQEEDRARFIESKRLS